MIKRLSKLVSTGTVLQDFTNVECGGGLGAIAIALSFHGANFLDFSVVSAMAEVVGLKSGISVQIRRTDGRQHQAIISSVNYETRSVLVEWPERGETRGKEIDFDTLFSLNDYLQPKLEPVEVSNIVRNPSRSSMNLRLPVPKTNYKPSRITSGPTTNGTSERTTRGAENVPPLQQQISSNNRNNNINDEPNKTINSQLNLAQFREPRAAASAAAVNNSSFAVNDKKPRRSKVVNEVEKLKQNREERRQKQAEAREVKEALMNIDPGNPNWQFLKMIREYQSGIDFRPLALNEPVESHQITVCVRKRPLNKKEINKKEIDVVSIPRKDTIVVHEPRNKVDLTKYLENQQFRFDYAFDETCSNDMVYRFTAQPLVQNIFEGGMSTCFAYGQTGSGKTHTMGGTFSGKQQDCNQGIYAMVAKDVFKFLGVAPYKSQRLIVTSSFFEIYSGKVFDLLADKAKLRVLEDGKQQVQVVGLTEKVVSSVGEVLTLIAAGNTARTSGQTSANSNSSRSHAVFQLTLRTQGAHKVHGKFSLIDLAGNERGADTMSSDRLTRMEGAEINKSLLALKECIRALGRKGAHLPFRASKLTQVLRDSFIGDNSRTCMIAMISPGMSSCEHSLNTLRYADRVKELAATDPMEESYETSPQDVEEPMEDDLNALRSQGEISAEMYNFHEVLSHLQEREDEMFDSLKVWVESRGAEDQLIQISRSVDYDQDFFATQLDNLLEERYSQLVTLRDRVKAFRQQLDAEEEISKKIATPRSGSRN